MITSSNTSSNAQSNSTVQINKEPANLTEVNLSFIGGGNMAQALIGGLLGQTNQTGGISPKQIMVSDPNDAVRKVLSAQGVQTTTDAQEALAHADVVVLAIKPQLFNAVLAPLAGTFTNQLIISVAAGTTVEKITALLGGYKKIVRCMPNTPALIQAGAAGLYATSNVSAQEKHIAESVIGASGFTLWVDDEELMHAVTAVSGSAPAYFFYFFEHIIKAGIDLGLDEVGASQLAMQTALGAAKMAMTSKDTPSELRRKVTSPNGTTQAAIECMQTHQVGELIEKAMQACANRSLKMAE